MKVVHLNTHEARGGAARAAHRLHDGLLRINVDSLMYVENRDSLDPTVLEFAPPSDVKSRLQRRCRAEIIRHSLDRYSATRPKGCDMFTDDRSRYGGELVAQIPQCDVMNLHWIARFVDYRSLIPPATRRTPVVWTLHDMSAFTGGCHYTLGCNRFTGHCGSCPQLGSLSERDLSNQIIERKRRLFARIPAQRLHVVTPSRWLADEVKRSLLGARFETSVIPYGLDLDVFAPRDRRLARNVLGVPENARVLVFLAHDLSLERKGHRLLVDALRSLRDDARGIFLISVGQQSGISTFDIPSIHIPHIENDRLLSLVYSAADLFAIASRQDNLPNTVLEAMACATPVVGFRVGGIEDMVRPNVTGSLVPPFDVDALGVEIVSLLDNPSKRAEMSANCRRVAEAEYNLELQARRYVSLYDEMLKARAKGSSTLGHALRG